MAQLFFVRDLVRSNQNRALLGMSLNITNNSRNNVLPLSQLATRAMCLAIFRANVRWRRLTDVTFELKRKMIEWKLPPHLKQAIFDGLGDAFRELQRWGMLIQA